MAESELDSWRKVESIVDRLLADEERSETDELPEGDAEPDGTPATRSRCRLGDPSELDS